MTNTSNRENAFLNRFRSVWARKRRVELGQVAVNSLLLALIGLGGLVIADYALELDRTVRVIGLGTMCGAVVLFAINALWQTVRCWSQPTTAAEIEAAFPQLGQSVRTTVQFGAMRVEEVQSEGIATKLVMALAEQTHQRALPLTIEDIVPSKRLIMIACGLAAGAVLLAGASSMDWQWSNATQRVILNEQPYRQLAIQPGDQTVDEGAGLQIHISLIGRTNREVTLFTRPVDDVDAEWTERKLEEQGPGDKSQATASQSGRFTEAPTSAAPISDALISRPHVDFVARLDRLTKPVQYRVTAGELVSPVYQVSIRRPLRIDEVKIELTPPSYTGQPTSTSLDLNLSVLQGTVAKFAIQFDKPVKSASLVFAPRKQPRDDEDRNEAEIVPLIPASLTSVAVELTLSEDRNYSIVAHAEDGTELPESKHRIRVREDQPPQVTIEEPNDAVEVHTLAELLMRVRVRDDYGLAKAGVIFQINNEQEVPLISQDFETVAGAAQEAAQTGTISPTTQAALEKILPLEFFELTQKDSVMYFAFAEDNRPGKPQRTETDMQFIDIRPFKRTYQVYDPDPMPGMGMGQELKSLAELIQRQRFALNRTMQIEKRAASGKKPDATTLDQLMQFEKELAESVRTTAQGLEARGFDDTELFYQAETAMLAAVDSLSVGKWENATLQMKDALKALVEQRDRTRLAIMKNPDPARLAALRQFDRAQAQKLRRPKTDKEEARELIRRLEELMNQEISIAGALEDDGGTPAIDEQNSEPEKQKSEPEKPEIQKPESQ